MRNALCDIVVQMRAPWECPGRRLLSLRRLSTSVVSGVVVGVAVGIAGAAQLSVPVSWIVAQSVVLTWVWRIGSRQDHEDIKRIAEEEGRTHSTDTGVLIRESSCIDCGNGCPVMGAAGGTRTGGAVQPQPPFTVAIGMFTLYAAQFAIARRD